jgi:PAS domain S-box-containing protein
LAAEVVREAAQDYLVKGQEARSMSTIEIIFYLFGTIFFFSTLAFAYYSFKNAQLMRGPLGHQLMAMGGVLFIAATMVGAVDHFVLPGSGLVYLEFFIWVAGLSAIVSGGALRAKEVRRVHQVSLFRVVAMMPNAIIYLTGIATLILISLPISILSVLSPIRAEPTWFNVGNMILWAFVFVIMAIAERRFHLAARPSAGAIASVEKEEEMLLREDILALWAYSDLTSRLAATAIPMIGIDTLRNVLSKQADEHDILKDCEMADNGALMVEEAVEGLTNVSEQEGIPKVLNAFSSLISRLIELYSAFASPSLAEELVARNYQATRERYAGTPMLLRILETTPEGFLEGEKLALLSKEELEARVKERTEELEEALLKAREATEALRASRASFHNIVEKSTDGIIVIDRKGVARFVNPAAECFFGCKAGDHVGELFGFPIVAGAVTELDIIHRGGGKGVGELRVVETEWEGEAASLALLRDITDRKRAQEALRESEEDLQAIFDSVGDGIALIDATGKVIKVNKRVIEIGGYKEDEIIGKRIALLKMFPPPSLAKMVYNLTRLLSGQDSPPFDVEVYTKAGEKLDVELRGSLLRKRGRVVGMLGVMRDITLRKQAEEQIRASLREKEMLLQEIHHRVKNNLQVISSLLYLQSKDTKDNRTLKIFQDSESRIRSMALVHERLYQSPDLARIDFAKYVQSLANYLFRSYGVNTNVIQLKINVDDVFLGVDTAIPCGLIVNELVSNSLKHAFPAGREGEIRIELRSDDEGECILMVSDNGVGFQEGLHFRDAGTLGLQLVNTLVAQLEGTIELDRGRGTTFKITFAEPRQRKGVNHGQGTDLAR